MDWYKSQCDGDWEHTFGVNIATIDNPGWSLKVDIVETSVEGKTVCEKSMEDEDDWYNIKCDGKVFKAYGDPTKLQFLIEYFTRFIQ